MSQRNRGRFGPSSEGHQYRSRFTAAPPNSRSLDLDSMRDRIIRAHASQGPDGVPQTCRAEGGSVVFRTEASAVEAARKLSAYVGAGVLVPRVCDHRDNDRQHWHLRSPQEN